MIPMEIWVMKKPGYDVYDFFMGDRVTEEYAVVTGIGEHGVELERRAYGAGAAVEPLFSINGPYMRSFTRQGGMQALVDSLCATFNVQPTNLETRVTRLEKAMYGEPRVDDG